MISKNYKIIAIVLVVLAIVGIGLFLNDYLNPVNTAIREGDVDTLIIKAQHGSTEEKIAAIKGFQEIKSLSSLESLQITQFKTTTNQKQNEVVDVLISVAENDPNYNVKIEAVNALGFVFNDKSVVYLKKIDQQPEISQLHLKANESLEGIEWQKKFSGAT